MAHFQKFNVSVQPNHPVSPETVFATKHSPSILEQIGLNMLVEVSISTAFLGATITPPQQRTITVMAHLDTGASTTSIDKTLASYLGLVPTGQQQAATASGLAIVEMYAADIAFLNTPLISIPNLQVGSCTLPHFNLENCLADPTLPTNFGVLIGRDLLSRWSITWHGPTSTVFISD